MKYPLFLSLLILILFQTSCNYYSEPVEEIDPSVVLWYDKPAENWTEALPLGNGRMGAMVYGNPENEVIQFNEETLWTGQPHDYSHRGAFRYLDRIRNLLWEGEQAKAEELANEHFMSQPLGQQAYQPFGNILLNFKDHENVKEYQRRLNIEKCNFHCFL